MAPSPALILNQVSRSLDVDYDIPQAPTFRVSLGVVIPAAGGASLVLLAVILVILIRRWFQSKKSTRPRVIDRELIPKFVITDMSMFPASVTVVDGEEALGRIISSYKPLASSEDQSTVIEGPNGVQLNLENGLQDALDRYRLDHDVSTNVVHAVITTSDAAYTFRNCLQKESSDQKDDADEYSDPKSPEEEVLPTCDFIIGEQDLGLMLDYHYLEQYWALSDDSASDSSHGSHSESTCLIRSPSGTYAAKEKVGAAASSSRFQSSLRSIRSLRSNNSVEGLDTRILDYIWCITGQGSSSNCSDSATVTRSNVNISGPAVRLHDDRYAAQAGRS